MATITKRYDLFDIHIEPKRKLITVKQRWKYNWLVQEGLSNWNYNKKKEFHDAVDSIIWQQWSGNYYAVSKISSFEKQSNSSKLSMYDRQDFKINFDVKWVISDPHWTVDVIKSLPYEPHNSRVDYSANKIFLKNTDILDSIVDPECNLNFNTVSHEFGHTIDADDEYGVEYMNSERKAYFDKHPSTSRFKYDDDYNSRMHIGSELRDRFINTIDRCLDNIIDGVQFTALLTNDYVKSISGRP